MNVVFLFMTHNLLVYWKFFNPNIYVVLIDVKHWERSLSLSLSLSSLLSPLSSLLSPLSLSIYLSIYLSLSLSLSISISQPAFSWSM